MTPLDRAWIWLILLSALTTAVALSPVKAPWSGLLILLFAWAKVRLIFLWYLELADVPAWRGGVLFALSGLMLVLLVLYALPAWM